MCDMLNFRMPVTHNEHNQQATSFIFSHKRQCEGW